MQVAARATVLGLDGLKLFTTSDDVEHMLLQAVCDLADEHREYLDKRLASYFLEGFK